MHTMDEIAASMVRQGVSALSLLAGSGSLLGRTVVVNVAGGEICVPRFSTNPYVVCRGMVVRYAVATSRFFPEPPRTFDRQSRLCWSLVP